jgi:hypothetical protein
MEPQNDPSPCPRRWWQHWVIKTVVISAVVIIAFYTIERQIGEYEWRDYQRKVVAKGIKFRQAVSEMASISDEENYAAAPIFRKLLAANDVVGETTRLLGLPSAGSRSAWGKESEPLYLENWQNAFIVAGWVPSAGKDPASDVLAGLERIEVSLSEIRQASLREKTRWPVKWYEADLVNTDVYGILQAATRAFGVRARALLALDRPDEALSEIRHMIRADRSLAEDPILLTELVRMALWGTIAGVCEEGIAADKWKDSHLQALMKECEAINLLEVTKHSLAGERAYGNSVFERLVTANRLEFTQLINKTQLPSGRTSIVSSVGWFVAPRGWVRQNQVDYNKLLDWDVEDIDVVNERVASRFSRARDVTMARANSGSGYYVLSSNLVPVWVVACEQAFELHSRIQQLRILCAATRFQHARGELPENLGQIVPEYLEKVPHDIMDGEPMRYRRTNEGGCVVWSIGRNRVDDGGVRGHSRPWANTNLDWVSQLPARPGR